MRLSTSSGVTVVLLGTSLVASKSLPRERRRDPVLDLAGAGQEQAGEVDQDHSADGGPAPFFPGGRSAGLRPAERGWLLRCVPQRPEGQRRGELDGPQEGYQPAEQRKCQVSSVRRIHRVRVRGGKALRGG